MLHRYTENINDIITKNKVLIIYGARRVGKTTMLKNLLLKSGLKYKYDSGDNIRIRELLSSQDFDTILNYAEGYDIVAIDEAQNIPEIGTALKILIDNKPELKIIATGSSSFELSQKTGEPLTGRKRTFTLFPLSMQELHKEYNKYELKEKLNDFLVFGTYPEVLTAKTKNEKLEILDELVNSYLLKDIFTLENIKKSKTITDLLKLLAFQTGQLISFHEISNSLGINVRTVERYIDLLEKSFVLYNLYGYAKNLRKEVRKKVKYYFYDNGVRNGIIRQFNGLEYRNDTGQLWENFIVSERLKKISYERIFLNRYFWRDYKQNEIDYIEEIDGNLHAYEIKFSKNKVKKPSTFLKNYNSTFQVIHKDNYLDFVL